MIELEAVEIRGTSAGGDFRGMLRFGPGLNILSARNSYGKSLAVTAIPWCLGLEPMFGLANNDASRFPAAVRDTVELDGGREVEVQFAEACLTLRRHDGATISLVRSIKGGQPEFVDLIEPEPNGSQRISRLSARRDSMADETGGLQRFLYSWVGLPRVPVMTLKGGRGELYLENIAPLFFIDQTEGWTDLQALQVFRYQLQDVSEAAVEYLLGARKALEQRFDRQQQVSLESRLKAEAGELAVHVADFCRRNGWSIAWSAHGSPDEIRKRWAARELSQVLKHEVNLDVASERERLTAKISALRTSLAATPKGEADMSPASQASQAVVELKTERHRLRAELRDARIQLGEQDSLLATIEHRWHSSRDVLRLKTEGIGRLDHVECPTCHRNLDPSTFDLSQQSEASVRAHIDALQRQRVLVQSNVSSLNGELTRLQHAVGVAEERLLVAERALAAVNTVQGASRERLAKIAMDLSAAERENDKLNQLTEELQRLESRLQKWISESTTWVENETDGSDLAARLSKFVDELRAQLIALGHSAVNASNASTIRLGERYVPYLNSRRLRSLGSASDHSRLVAAYVLALADASRHCSGYHPGFVVLDEPQQQNPDDDHMELLLRFLEVAAGKKETQVIVTTFLRSPEVDRL